MPAFGVHCRRICWLFLSLWVGVVHLAVLQKRAAEEGTAKSWIAPLEVRVVYQDRLAPLVLSIPGVLLEKLFGDHVYPVAQPKHLKVVILGVLARVISVLPDYLEDSPLRSIANLLLREKRRHCVVPDNQKAGQVKKEMRGAERSTNIREPHEEQPTEQQNPNKDEKQKPRATEEQIKSLTMAALKHRQKRENKKQRTRLGQLDIIQV